MSKDTTSESAAGGSDAGSALWLRLAGRQDEIAERIFARLRERLPSVEASGPALTADVRAAMGATLSAILAVFAAGLPLDALHARVHELALRRATEATIPLEESLLAYEIAAVELLDTVASEVEEGRAGNAVLITASRRLIELLQTTTSAVATAYQTATESAATEFEHRMTAVLETVLGRRPDDGRSEERARALGVVDLPPRWCCVSSPLGAEAGDTVRSVRRALPVSLAGRLDGRLVLLTRDRPPDLPVAAVGVSSIAEEGTASAFDVAVAAATLALHLGRRRIDAGPLGPLAIMLTSPPSLQASFVSTHLGALTEPGHEDLLRSLAAWLRAGGSTAMAARELFVHRHTLDYRMAKVRELTGLDLADPMQRFLAETALFLLGRYP